MTITIFVTEKGWPRIFRTVPITPEQKKDFQLSAWKRLYEDPITLPPGIHEIARMSHHYGIPQEGTLVRIENLKETEGAFVGGVFYEAGSDKKPLLQSHGIETRFG